MKETTFYQSVSTLDVRINQTGEVMCKSCNKISEELHCTNITRRVFVSGKLLVDCERLNSTFKFQYSLDYYSIVIADVNGRFGFTGPDSVSVTEGDDVNVTCGASVYNFTEIKGWRSENPEKQGGNFHVSCFSQYPFVIR